MDYSADEKDRDTILNDIADQYGTDYKTLAAAYGDEAYFDEDVTNLATEYLVEQKTAAGEGEEVANIEGIKKINDYEVEVTTDGFSATTLYNLGVMSYTERYREMATLKVIGFKDSKIGRLLISQNLWLTVLGILIGIPAGIGILQYLLTALASEYELKLVLGLPTWLVSILLTFGVSLAVGLMVARKNRHIDMVAALKTAE